MQCDMTMIKIKLINQLHRELDEYNSMLDDYNRRDKKQFINGFMIACRLAGVTYGELNKVINQKVKMRGPDLDIPAYIRFNLRKPTEK